MNSIDTFKALIEPVKKTCQNCDCNHMVQDHYSVCYHIQVGRIKNRGECYGWFNWTGATPSVDDEVKDLWEWDGKSK